MGTPLDWSAARILLTVAVGLACRSTAHAPATCGADIEVPLKKAYPPPMIDE
jgi:hypothetical protein